MNSLEAVSVVVGVGAISTYLLSQVGYPFARPPQQPTGIETMAHAPVGAAIVGVLMAVAMVVVAKVGVDESV